MTDSLHEFEMAAALLAAAKARNDSAALIRGLEREVEFWRDRALREVSDAESVRIPRSPSASRP